MSNNIEESNARVLLERDGARLLQGAEGEILLDAEKVIIEPPPRSRSPQNEGSDSETSRESEHPRKPSR